MKKLSRSKLLLLALSASFGLAIAAVPHPANASQINGTHQEVIASRPVQQSTQKINRPVQAANSRIKQNRKPAIYSYHNGAKVGQDHLIHHHPLHLAHTTSAVAIDGKTGQVVYAKHPNQKVLAASTSKLMTLYLAERKLARHPQAWSQKLHISHSLVRMGHDTSLDGFDFKSGKRYSVGNLFKAAFIASDDNAAIRLGEWVGGSNRNFIRMMNKQSRLWHLRADFVSASGLENDDLARYGFDDKGGYYSGNKISAKSLGIVAYHLIKDFPSIMKYSTIEVGREDGQNLVNYNYMLPGRRYYTRSLHVDGFKTGYTPAAGYCFVGSSKKPGKDRLITVSLGNSSFPEEFLSTKAIMKHVYKYSSLYRK